MTNPSDIPVVIPCGGQGTRIREASERLPKPMIDVGGRPILWHIMKMYGRHGFRRFVLPLGYKAWVIKEYFLRYREQLSDFTVHLAGDHRTTYHGRSGVEDWEVTCVDTGMATGTAGRLARVREHLDADVFMLTYGDGVSDIDLSALLEAHRDHGRLGTVTAIHPQSRFGELEVEENQVMRFAEKPDLHVGWINGGFFVFQHEFLDYVAPDSGMLETDPLPRLVRDEQLGAYQHRGFWRSMDTYREWIELDRLWVGGEAPWKTWED